MYSVLLLSSFSISNFRKKYGRTYLHVGTGCVLCFGLFGFGTGDINVYSINPLHTVCVNWRFIDLNQAYKSYDQYFYVHRLFLYSKIELLTQVFFDPEFSCGECSLKKKFEKCQKNRVEFWIYRKMNFEWFFCSDTFWTPHFTCSHPYFIFEP